MAEIDLPNEVAYYYPEPYWLAQEGGWIKSLLLFFDQVAIATRASLGRRSEIGRALLISCFGSSAETPRNRS